MVKLINLPCSEEILYSVPRLRLLYVKFLLLVRNKSLRRNQYVNRNRRVIVYELFAPQYGLVYLRVVRDSSIHQ